MGISSARDFLGTTPSYTLIRDPILRLCHRLIACSIVGRSQAPEKVVSGGQFVARLAEHFGLLTDEILGGLAVIAPKLPIIDMTKLRMARLEEDVHEIRRGLTEQREELPIRHMFRPMYHTRGASDRGLARPAPPQHSVLCVLQTALVEWLGSRSVKLSWKLVVCGVGPRVCHTPRRALDGIRVQRRDVPGYLKYKA
ncbi:hypothetical protein Tco_0487882 [Tanacetum coccineum]